MFSTYNASMSNFPRFVSLQCLSGQGRTVDMAVAFYDMHPTAFQKTSYRASGKQTQAENHIGDNYPKWSLEATNCFPTLTSYPLNPETNTAGVMVQGSTLTYGRPTKKARPSSTCITPLWTINCYYYNSAYLEPAIHQQAQKPSQLPNPASWGEKKHHYTALPILPHPASTQPIPSNMILRSTRVSHSLASRSGGGGKG